MNAIAQPMAVPSSKYLPITLLVGLTQLLLTADLSLISVALSSVGKEWNIAPAALSWVVTGSAITFAGLVILGGRVVDRYGQRLCFLLGMGLFAASAVALVFAPNFETVIAARVLQGLSCALFQPANYSLVFTALPDGPVRHRALGVVGAAQGISMLIGLLGGGTMTTMFNWRAVFLLELPLALVAIGLAVIAIPPKNQSAEPAAKKPADVLGALLLMTAPALFICSVSVLEHWGWTSLVGLAVLAGAILSAAALVFVEHRAADPLVPPVLLARAGVLGPIISVACLLASMVGAFVLLNLYTQRVLGLSAMAGGLAMLPYAVALAIAGRLAVYTMDRWSLKTNVAIGIAVQIVGTALLCYAPLLKGYSWALVSGTMLSGAGGLIAALAITAQTGGRATADHKGISMAMMFTTDKIGASIGVALSLAALTLTNYQVAFALSGVFALLTVIATYLLTADTPDQMR